MPLRRVPGYLPAVTEPLPGRRPPPPHLRLPRPRRRPGGVVASLVLHALILLSLIRFGVDWIAGTGDGAGPRGGGGGGAGGSARYVELPALPAPPPPRVTAAAPLATVVPPDPVPVKPETPVPDVPVVPPPAAPTVAAPATGTGGGPGQGPGTGGGAGAGTGGGVGNDSGPGRGGAGEYISLPNPRTLLLPAPCAHGRTTVRFWVEADGSVSRVSVEPSPKDAGCRREMREKMLGYQFSPAHTRDGRAVAFVFEVHFQQ